MPFPQKSLEVCADQSKPLGRIGAAVARAITRGGAGRALFAVILQTLPALSIR
jgi:hypothetical protein